MPMPMPPGQAPPPPMNPGVQGMEEFGPKSEEPTRIVLFFAPWCPHCKGMMAGEDSVWEKLKKKHGHHRGLTLDQVNCDEQPELATRFGIKGFPTILKMKKDKVEQYEGDRTLESLEGFIGSD